jgi:DNA-binding MarR family transcriptional regulator
MVEEETFFNPLECTIVLTSTLARGLFLIICLKWFTFFFRCLKTKLDLFERKIIEVLSSGEPKDLHNLLLKLDFSHNTLRQHLDQLIARGLVERRKVPKEGPGRPSYRYSLSGDARASQRFVAVSSC